jgi:ligand-binding sensor domain-containing protein/anti-sigma regulatory factor (Ser/Thr protein kinase)
VLRCLLVLLLASCGVLALSPERRIWHFGYKVWRDLDGLPQNTVNAVAQTEDGYLWLATEAGLVRFSGRTFHTFNTESSQEFRTNSITALQAGKGNRLWVGTRNGLLLMHAGSFQRFAAGEAIRTLALDETQQLWVGTNRGVFLWRDRQLQRIGTEQQTEGDRSVRALYARSTHQIVGSSHGAFRMQSGRQQSLHSALPSDSIRAILADRKGRVWIGAEANGLYLLHKGQLQRINAQSGGLSSSSVRALLEDRHGNIWVGTMGGGLNRVHEQSDGRLVVDAMGTKQGLSSDHVRSLFEDREGSIWIGTEAGGLAQLREGQAVTWTTNDGLRSNFIRAVRGDSLGRLWIGTEGAGLHRMEGGRLTADSRSRLPDGFITALHEDKRGNLWIGTEGKGAWRLGANGDRQYFATTSGRSDNSVWAISETPDGLIWLGTSHGLARVGKSVQILRQQDGLLSNSIRALHWDGDAMWIALRTSGLQRLRHGKLEQIKLPTEAAAAAISSFLSGPNGELWLTSSQGLLHWDGSKMFRFAKREGIAGGAQFQVLRDNNKQLWISSSQGIINASEDELRRVARGEIPQASIRKLGVSDGMASSECSGDAHPAGWKTADGMLWFATIRGLTQINPAHKLTPMPHPQVAIEEVLVDGRRVNTPEKIVAPPGNQLLSFRVAALTYLHPDKTRFRYRLEGLDRDWIEESAAREEVSYHKTPPGSYRFQVMSSQSAGTSGNNIAAVSVHVEPFFYETPWFLGGCAAVLLGGGLAAWRIRHRNLQREIAAVLSERTRIAREMHDTLLQGFAGAALQLDAIQKHWRKEPEVAEERLSGVLEQIDGCLQEARLEIEELRQPARGFSQQLRNVAERACGSVELVLDVTPAAEQIPSRVQTGLLKIAREAVSNAARHASPGVIRVKLQADDSHVTLLTEDDGRGIPPGQQQPGHFGLIGMRERAQSMGGSFTVNSSPGKGTAVEVKVPLHQQL